MNANQPNPKWNAPEGTEPVEITFDETQEADADRIAGETQKFRAALEHHVRTGRDDRIYTQPEEAR